ncbi:MAG TPA: hypothetical protein DCZ92_00960 [Elusimicrobia bacterium]|nr:MAG: hypothetical protein A2016_04655 [Elusimicrobia bacterium GWF2_62_30]HBA59396.1 hypothetical protein [Elusimicrobiota bacterium]
MIKRSTGLALLCILSAFCAGSVGAVAVSTYTSSACGFKDTGLRACYDATAILGSCPGLGQSLYGQDGNFASTAKDASYTIRNPVAVSSVTVDNRTGLTWVTNPVDAEIDGTYLWDTALGVCEGLTYAGYDDWRLPKIRELLSIVDFTAGAAPLINTDFFLNNASGMYWSSTSNAVGSGYPVNAWYVDFSGGSTLARANMPKASTSNYIRCVRGGP